VGVTRLIDVAVFAVMVAATPPTETVLIGSRFAPEMVMLVPPPVPLVVTGDTVDNDGGVAKVKADARVALPPGLVTTTATAVVEAVLVGVVTVTLVAVRAVIVACVPPKVTDVVDPRAVPVSVTDCPPALDPNDWLNEETVGTGR
jgi:predicted benzoate:H+ symporter BenE